jgi:Amt family ammonium transporter
MLDGVTSGSGGIDGVGIQVGKQFAEITAISSYSFIVSCILLYILKFIPGMHLRVTEEAELAGLDMDQFFDELIGDHGLLEENKRIDGMQGHETPRSIDTSERVVSESKA